MVGAVKFTVEHFRAIEDPGSPLGYRYLATGVVDTVEAPDEESAAISALGVGDDGDDPGMVSYSPGEDLYGFLGEDESVRVTPPS